MFSIVLHEFAMTFQAGIDAFHHASLMTLSLGKWRANPGSQSLGCASLLAEMARGRSGTVLFTAFSTQSQHMFFTSSNLFGSSSNMPGVQ